jgi:hypothetical protein
MNFRDPRRNFKREMDEMDQIYRLTICRSRKTSVRLIKNSTEAFQSGVASSWKSFKSIVSNLEV